MSDITVRQSKRMMVLCSAILRDSSGSRLHVQVINLSCDGCAVYGDQIHLANGRIYSLKVEGLETLVGTVKWARPGYAGIQFSASLSPYVAESLGSQFSTADGINWCDEDTVVAWARAAA
jgi:hypothetical protein